MPPHALPLPSFWVCCRILVPSNDGGTTAHAHRPATCVGPTPCCHCPQAEARLCGCALRPGLHVLCTGGVQGVGGGVLGGQGMAEDQNSVGASSLCQAQPQVCWLPLPQRHLTAARVCKPDCQPQPPQA